MKRLRWLVLALACAIALPTAAVAEPEAQSTAEAEEAQLAAWVQRLDDAKARLEAAHEALEQLDDAKGRGASRRYPRGDAKAKYLDDLETARAELADAERALPDLVEEARRDGVPPGVLSDYEDLTAGGAANQAEGNSAWR